MPGMRVFLFYGYRSCRHRKTADNTLLRLMQQSVVMER
jgi:hypothetical protein